MVAKSGFLGYVLIFVQTKMEHLCVFVTYRIMPRIHAFLVFFGFGRYKRKFYSGIQSIRLKKGYTYTDKLTRTLKSYANYDIPMMKTFKSQY